MARYAKTKMTKDIDRLGEIKAEIATLQDEAAEIKQRLVDHDVEEAEGKLFHFKMVHYAVNQVDYKGIVEKLAPGKRILNRFTKEVDRVRMVINART